MAETRIRVDRLAPLELVDALPAMPSPDRTPAVRTREGYLEADALLARDGLLRYSDGVESWLEYRPRAELEAAAATWAHAPVTDDHPPKMVDAATYAAVNRGVVLGAPSVVEIDGVGYLRARLSIRDADLVAKVLAGTSQLSIGFRAMVEAMRDGVAPDGTRCDAVQTDLAGNHVAVVAQGRAGPACRVMLDSAHVACYTPAERAIPRGTDLPMLKAALDKLNAAIAARKDHVVAVARKAVEVKADEVGMPTTSAKLIGPDGTEVEVPTWVAALVAEALEQRKAGEAAAAPAPDAEGEIKPEPKPEDAPAGAPEPKPEDEEKPMTPDQINALVRKRGRLVRLAADAGVKADTVDTATDVALARAFVGARCPHLRAQADKADGDVLDALVEVAAATPKPVVNPFEKPRRITDAADVPAEVEQHARYLMAQGVR